MSLIVLGMVLIGCGSSPENTGIIPVHGTVVVDGKVACGVTICLHPENGKGTIATAATDERGQFDVSTNTKGDGAAPGQYAVTFEWGNYDAMRQQMVGNRLSGLYASSASTPIHWTIDPKTERHELGIVTLQSK